MFRIPNGPGRRAVVTLVAILAIALLAIAACGDTQPPPATSAQTEAAAPTIEPSATPVRTVAAVVATEPSAAPTPTPERAAEPTATSAPEPSAERVLTDDAGREVSLPATAIRRIVSLAPSATEILFAIGAGDRVVGRDDFSNYPAETAGIETVGSFTPDIERIVDLEPDLTVAATITSPSVIEKLEAAGIVVWIADSPDVRGVVGSIQRLGEAVGLAEEAAVVAAALAEDIEAIVQTVAQAEQRPRVFHELDATDPSKPYTVGPGNFVHDLIVLAGGDNVFADAPTPFPQVGFEEVLVRDPEVIILADAPFGTTVDAVKARIGWDVIEAVANDRMLAVSQELSDQISRPGPRIAKGLEAFARFLHPELFD